MRACAWVCVRMRVCVCMQVNISQSLRSGKYAALAEQDGKGASNGNNEEDCGDKPPINKNKSNELILPPLDYPETVAAAIRYGARGYFKSYENIAGYVHTRFPSPYRTYYCNQSYMITHTCNPLMFEYIFIFLFFLFTCIHFSPWSFLIPRDQIIDKPWIGGNLLRSEHHLR